MFVPRLNDAPVVIGDVGKKLEDRNNRRDDGVVAVSTATESQRKGSAPPGIDYDFDYCESVNGRFFS